MIRQREFLQGLRTKAGNPGANGGRTMSVSDGQGQYRSIEDAHSGEGTSMAPAEVCEAVHDLGGV